MNVLEQFLTGRAARREQDAANQVAAMNTFLQKQGGAIFGGDQNALAQLSGMGPQGLEMAFNVQGQVDQRQRAGVADQRAERADQRAEWGFQREMEDYAKGISAEQAAAEAAQVENAVKGAMMAETPQQFDAMMEQLGQPDLKGQFANREALAAQYLPMAEVLKMRAGQADDPVQAIELQKAQLELEQMRNPEPKPGFRLATPDEAASYGAGGGQIGPDGRFYPNKEGDGMVVYGPDGQPIVSTGGAAPKPFTEAQSKDVVFATRAKGALEALDPVADALTSRGEIVAESVPLGLARGMQSKEFQLARQAADEFLQAILRKDTGAAITDGEQAAYGKTFLPQPGDKADVLTAKKASRARAIAALEAGMSPSQILAQENALEKGGDTATTSGGLRPFDVSRDKPRHNADGSISTEVTATENAPDGGYWNIPTLWWDKNGNPQEVMLDDAIKLARDYEKSTGKRFPRFKTVDEGVAAAKTRSTSGGASSGNLALPSGGVSDDDLLKKYGG